VAVLGNHEFDFGPDVAKERIGEARYPWLGTNVLDKDGEPAAGGQDLRLIPAGGYRIGFFGVLTPKTAQLSSPGPDITFTDPVLTATRAVADLRRMGADMVVAMTHQDIADDRALAARVKGIDLILGGHDHEPITFDEGSTLIIKAGYDLHYLTVIDVTVERVTQKAKELVVWRAAWRYLPTEDVLPHAQVQAIVARWEKQLDEDLGQPVGVTSVDLDTRRSSVRTEETSFGDLVADAIRSATGSDIAITNGGGIRGDRTYSAGTQLTRKDILSELPFGNLTVVTELTGSDIRAALENGVSQVEDTAGRFPQVSGLSFVWDPREPPGSRIVAVEVGGQPLDPSRIYRVATNDYMLIGGDGYVALEKGKVVIDPSAATLMATTVMSYITALGGSIDHGAGGRITRVR
jgi:2',3'-cyclic-nucleotide 2'-phosphodiesterase (5'-nucleotidase family)